jgi:hypothetical protein
MAHPVFFSFGLFLAIWLVVSVNISHISGWALLAERFRFSGDFSGPRWSWKSAAFRWRTNYNGCLTFGVNEQGLYLRTNVLFSFAHPPLLIPWNEISASRQRRYFFDGVQLELGRAPSVPMWVRKPTADLLKKAAGSAWPPESLAQSSV